MSMPSPTAIVSRWMSFTYPDATIIDQLYLARLRASAPLTATGTLTRFHVPLAGDAPVTRRILADVPLELPRINYQAHAGRPYRYVWGTGVQTKGDGVLLSVVLDIDKDRSFLLLLDAASLHELGPRRRAACHPVPRPRKLPSEPASGDLT